MTWSFDLKSQQLHQGTPLPHAGSDGTPCTWPRTPRQRGSRFHSHLQCCSELFFLPASVAAEVPASPRNHFCLREPSHRQPWGYPDEGSLCDAAEKLRKGRCLSSAGFGWFLSRRRCSENEGNSEWAEGACGVSSRRQLVNTFLRISGHFLTPGSFPLLKSPSTVTAT